MYVELLDIDSIQWGTNLGIRCHPLHSEWFRHQPLMSFRVSRSFDIPRKQRKAQL